MSLPLGDDIVLDHIAIAVEELETSVEKYQSLGLDFSDKREIVESQKVKTAFAQIDEHAHIELLESTDSEGPIGKFIQKNGAGIHHLCFKVKDVIQKQKELEAKGMRFIATKPFAGANNCLVNFIHPKSMNGVLIEISQKRGES